MIVLKFGGSILRTSTDFALMRSVVSAHVTDSIVVVVSALFTTTRDLHVAGAKAEQGLLYEALHVIDAIANSHLALYAELFPSADDTTFKHSVAEVCDDARSLLKGISITRECTPRTKDLLVSAGETLSMEIVTQYLREHGVQAEAVHATDIMITDSSFGAAVPLRTEVISRCRRTLLPLLESGTVVVFPGFVGRDEAGEVTTMGLESSNLSAALIAEGIQAKSLYIYTDVAGIRTADPHIVESSNIIPHLGFVQAYTLAMNGVKLIYPSMIEPLKRAQIPLVVKSLIKGHAGETMISDEFHNDCPSVVQLREPVSLVRYRFNTLKSYQRVHATIENTIAELSVTPIVLQSPLSLSIIAPQEFAKRFILSGQSDYSSSVTSGLALVSVLFAPANPLLQIGQDNFNELSTCDTIALLSGVEDAALHALCPVQNSKRLASLLHRIYCEL